MKHLVLVFTALFCFINNSIAQNLVPNPSFENHTDCNYFLLANAYPWCTASSNGGQSTYYHPCSSNPTYHTPMQYLDNCFKSYQIPHSGVAYIDIASYVQSSTQESSVPQVKLIDTLIAGKIYCVTYYVSVWNNARFTIDKLGALLTPTPFPCATPGGTLFVNIAGQYTPQVISTPSVAIGDTLNWTEISGSFVASGNEAYIAIGDFFTHSQHYIQNTYPTNCNGLAYYYVDDVSVEEVEIAKTKNDTLIYSGDSIVIGNNASEAASFLWQPSAGLNCINCPNPTASPNVTTTYTVTKTQCKTITIDEVTITVSPTGILDIEGLETGLKLIPNPTNGIINIISRFDFEKVELLSITGQTMLTDICNTKTHVLELKDFNEGIYFVKISYRNGTALIKKIIKF